MKMTKLRDMGVDDLLREEKSLRQALFNLRVQHAIGQLEKPHKLRQARRDLAQVLTTLRQKRGSAPKETR
jgi:large subunit ribosomal protein L29